MSAQTDSQLTTRAAIVRDETQSLANSAIRIGALLVDINENKINIDKISTSISADTGSTTKVPTVAAVEAAVIIKTVKVNVSSSDILAFNTTPKALIAAPGVGKFINPISIGFMMKSGNTPYATQTAVQFSCGGVIDAITSVLNNTANNTKYFSVNISGYSVNNASNVNSALYIYNPTGNPTAGDGNIDVYITYSIVTV